MMFRVALECTGIPADEGETAARDIAQNFLEHRTHHSNVVCSYADGKLTLVAENDFDPKGLALIDEYSDCICAFIGDGIDGDITLKSATEF